MFSGCSTWPRAFGHAVVACFLLPTLGLVEAAAGRGELTIGITQFPSTLNPSIDVMAAKSYVLGAVLRPFTVYDAAGRRRRTRVARPGRRRARLDSFPPAHGRSPGPLSLDRQGLWASVAEAKRGANPDRDHAVDAGTSIVLHDLPRPEIERQHRLAFMCAM